MTFLLLAAALSGDAIVDHVVDGESLVLTTGERVRLLGIDAPESTQPCSSEATVFLRAILPHGSSVSLEHDREPKRDRSGRLLAYVFSEGRFVNQDMVTTGLARVEPRWRFGQEAAFLALESKARDAKGGLWGAKCR